MLQYYKKYRLKPKNFRNGNRKQRLAPHQTDVDNFLLLPSKEKVNMFFGNLLMTVLKKIKARCIEGLKLQILVDNTEYVYYRKPNMLYGIETNRKLGTRFYHMFQGHALHEPGRTLFTEFYLLQKGKYRYLNIPHSVEWLKWSRINLSHSLTDKKIYSAALSKDLKNRNAILIPLSTYLIF